MLQCPLSITVQRRNSCSPTWFVSVNEHRSWQTVLHCRQSVLWYGVTVISFTWKNEIWPVFIYLRATLELTLILLDWFSSLSIDLACSNALSSSSTCWSFMIVNRLSCNILRIALRSSFIVTNDCVDIRLNFKIVSMNWFKICIDAVQLCWRLSRVCLDHVWGSEAKAEFCKWKTGAWANNFFASKLAVCGVQWVRMRIKFAENKSGIRSRTRSRIMRRLVVNRAWEPLRTRTKADRFSKVWMLWTIASILTTSSVKYSDVSKKLNATFWTRNRYLTHEFDWRRSSRSSWRLRSR